MIPYRATLTLSAASDPTQIHALLRDPNGASGSGLLHFDPSAPAPKLDRSWEDTLHDLALDKLSSPEQELLGAALFQILTAPRPLGEAWAAIRAAAGGAPLHLTVELPPDHPVTETLPWELLRDGQGHLFHVPGSALTRTYTGLPTRPVQLSARPRVLLLWARPDGTTRFDPSPHVERLREIFGDRLDVIQRGSEHALAQHLKAAREAADPYEVLHVLAHGYATPIGDTLDRGVILDGPMGKENVPGDRLAALLRGHGLRLVFLCSCQGGVVAEGLLGFTGTAQRLLSPAGASVPVVVATQANLPIPGSAALAGHFYRALTQDGGDPARALARARHWAYGNGTAWATPILMRCPAPEHDPGVGPARDLGQLDGPRPTFRQRPEVLTEGLDALQSSRLVSVVGLPGIGKTEIGKEIARQALHEREVDRVLYLEAHRGLDGEALRVRLGGFLGLHKPPETDEALAAAMERDERRLLIVLDNAEDMMPDKDRQAAFKAQLGAWLRGASRLRVLLTTRWLVGSSALGERRVGVPPLPREEMDHLLREELTARGALREGEPGSAAWDELLKLLDGHPRSLILVAPQLAEPGMTLPDVVRRLQRFKETAYADSDLIGQEDAWDGLEPSEQARMRSLVASMDLSWATLTGRYPTAALAYRELSLFPAGLPDEVARLVTQDEETLSLKRLTDLSLVERRAGRTFSPVPLQWYAERKRRADPVDEGAVFARAVEGFVGFVEECNSAVARSEYPALSRFLTERANLTLLVEHAPPTHTPGKSPLARLAANARNLLMMLNLFHLWEVVASRGLEDARLVGDLVGEASALESLGDLFVRTDRLAPAEEAYGQALQLFHSIHARVGEANTRRALGHLYVLTDQLSRAEDAFGQALYLYESEDNSSIGRANTFLARGSLHARMDRLRDAEESLTQALSLYRDEEHSLGEANARKALGDLFVRTDRVGCAEESYLQARQLFHEARVSLGEANTQKALGDLYARTTRLKLAEEAYTQALPLFQGTSDSVGLAELQVSLGDLYVSTDRLDLGQDAYTCALQLFRIAQSKLGEAKALSANGRLYSRLSQLVEAESLYSQALQLYQLAESERGEAEALQNLGAIYIYTARLDIAEKAYDQARIILQHREDSVGMANVLHHLGVVYFRTDRLELAESAYKQALQYCNQATYRLGTANTTQALGDLYSRTSRLTHAEDAYIRARNYYDDAMNTIGTANALKALGDLYFRTNRLSKADAAYSEALQLSKRGKYKIGEANALTALGNLAQSQRRFSEALGFYSNSDALYRTSHDRLGLSNVLAEEAKCHAMLGDLTRATKAAHEALRLGREIGNGYAVEVANELLSLLSTHNKG